jgi:RNA polymerase II-associated protein 2
MTSIYQDIIGVANMANAATPKSILKKPSYPATSSSKADRDREVALYHANLIQERKDVELTIVLSMETLIDYPLATAPFDASNPSPADAKMFKSLLRPFQPSDYDALILERNINEHCGYALCRNPRVKEGGGGKYRIVGKYGKAKDFRVVDKEELEKWCSEACAKRALYVRVQLSHSPAWERGGSDGVQIDLLDEPKSEEDQVAERMEKMDLSSEEGLDKMQDAADLALERGDKGHAAKNRMMDIKIEENQPRGPAQAPSFNTEDLSNRLDTMHITLEGHTPSFGSRRHRRHDEEFEDIQGENFDVDTDWGF